MSSETVSASLGKGEVEGPLAVVGAAVVSYLIAWLSPLGYWLWLFCPLVDLLISLFSSPRARSARVRLGRPQLSTRRLLAGGATKASLRPGRLEEFQRAPIHALEWRAFFDCLIPRRERSGQ